MKSSNRPRELRVLIDECLPIQLRHLVPDHDVRTVMYMTWRSLKNGELLSAAEREGFDVFVTADAGIAGDHITGRHLAVVIVPTNRRKALDGIGDLLRSTIDEVAPGECRIIPRQAVQALQRPGRRRS